MTMLEIKDLHASVDGKEILKGLNLSIKPGEVHAIMGPNGSGKSTLSQVLAGNDAYEVTSGSISYQGQDLLDMATEDRAREGVFLAFQYPVEIPGVSVTNFIKTAINGNRKAKGLEDMPASEMLKMIKEKADLLTERIRFRETGNNDNSSNYLMTIQSAITGFNLLEIKYNSLNKNITKRTIEPFAIYSTQGNWLLIAFCRLRKEFRVFRIDLIQELKLENTTFEPHNMSLERYFEICKEKYQNTPDIPLSLATFTFVLSIKKLFEFKYFYI